MKLTLINNIKWIISVIYIIFPAIIFANCDQSNGENIEWENCDFAGHDFSGKTISAISIHNVNFTGANFNNATLKISNLTSTNFTGTKMMGAKISFNELEDVQFDNADMRNVVFTGYRYKFVTFGGANLQGATINVGRGGDVSYDGANLKGANYFNSICGSGSVGFCNEITKFNLNYKEDEDWPKFKYSETKKCKEPYKDPGHFRVVDSIDLDGDGTCDSRGEVLGNHGSYPTEYYFQKYNIPHGDEVNWIDYYKPLHEGGGLQIEMQYSDGRRVLYRLIDGIYQVYRIDHFKPDYNTNVFVYDYTELPINKSNEINKKGESFYRQGNIAKSIEFYNKAIEINRYNYFAMNNLSLSLFKQGNYKKAIAVLWGIKDEGVNTTVLSATYFNRARAQEKLGNLYLAKFNYSEAYRVKRKKVYREQVNRLEDLLFKLSKESDSLIQDAKNNITNGGNEKVTVKLLEEAFAKNQGNLEVCLLLADIYIRDNEGKKALKLIREDRYRDKGKKNTTLENQKLANYLSMASEQIGDYGAAIMYLKMANENVAIENFDLRLEKLVNLKEEYLKKLNLQH